VAGMQAGLPVQKLLVNLSCGIGVANNHFENDYSADLIY
jgi:hypothetical protein